MEGVVSSSLTTGRTLFQKFLGPFYDNDMSFSDLFIFFYSYPHPSPSAHSENSKDVYTGYYMNVW
jgi:hypothetical protein